MNWIRIGIDCDVYATEIAGAGCFVRFFNHIVPVFAPGVTIRTTKVKQKEVHALVAAPFSGTQISFTTDTATSQAGWVGDAGDRLDKKLAKLMKKRKTEPETALSVTTFSTLKKPKRAKK